MMIAANQRSMVYADGTKMCIGFPGHGLAYLIAGPIISHLSLEHRFDGLIGVSLEILAARSTSISADDAAAMFTSADSMTVNELLAAAFQKMEARSDA
jgi:hypothetical protein